MSDKVSVLLTKNKYLEYFFFYWLTKSKAISSKKIPKLQNALVRKYLRAKYYFTTCQHFVLLASNHYILGFHFTFLWIVVNNFP